MKNEKFESPVVLKKKGMAWLSSKPFWVWLVTYTIVAAIIFSVIYLVTKSLTLVWWHTVLGIMIVGTIWSGISYNHNANKIV